MELKISPTAIIVDISHGKGKETFEGFLKKRETLSWKPNGKSTTPKASDQWTAFADFVGADLIKHTYSSHAYVIKNGGVILGQNRITRPIKTPLGIKDELRKHNFDAKLLTDYLNLDHLLVRHHNFLLEEAPPKVHAEQILNAVTDYKLWNHNLIGRTTIRVELLRRSAHHSTTTPKTLLQNLLSLNFQLNLTRPTSI